MATATATRKPRVRKPRVKPTEVAQNRFAETVSGMSVLGEIITWNPRGPHTHAAVVKALSDASLEPKVAKEFLPANAFNRALKKLEEERLIDVLGEDGSQITFQFSKRLEAEDSEGRAFEYKKELRLRLDKENGNITCKDAAVKAKAEKELERSMTERTTSDISTIIDRLFRGYVTANPTGDLIPIRDQGGAYMVLATHAGFVDKMQTFIEALGGKMNRFPVPAGSKHGDAAVQNQLSVMLAGLIGEHKAAVGKFTLHTRADSIKTAATKINDTRVKIEAYSSYLREESDRLLGEVDAANAELTAAVERLTEEKKESPEITKGEEAIAVLTNEPMKFKDILAKSDPDHNCYRYLQEQVKAGRVIKQGKTYRLNPDFGKES